MKDFKEFLSNSTQPAQQVPSMVPAKEKKWKASKEEILSFWQRLRPDTPIQIKPIDYTHKGSTYGEDGLRITGSPQFISSVLARLKEFLQFETPSQKLAVTYRETESPSKVQMGQAKTSYDFYVATKQRGQS